MKLRGGRGKGHAPGLREERGSGEEAKRGVEGCGGKGPSHSIFLPSPSHALLLPHNLNPLSPPPPPSFWTASSPSFYDRHLLCAARPPAPQPPPRSPVTSASTRPTQPPLLLPPPRPLSPRLPPRGGLGCPPPPLAMVSRQQPRGRGRLLTLCRLVRRLGEAPLGQRERESGPFTSLLTALLQWTAKP